ncbi:Putative ribonuclease H protein [Dendrobium catenatum]|uniref:Ribonuclease H protein n=1 Tax=Dendrobium catenatum TaxID=906689 RepID=A0A2I0WBL6_9ASPA|nr:Putative ribonuclease H protein [Dendrobium catenatum]
MWNDFRPISLCSFFNKLISKILATRLIEILPRIISVNQTGFVKGRIIFDNILLVQEMTHDINSKGKGGNIIYKLDISKAYDNLNWNFLYKILSLFGFCNVFIQLIKNSIENCFFSVIINGGQHGFFNSSQGLRQGDPLSPALFIIAMDYISRGMEELYKRHKSLYFHTKGGFPVSHLCFADDFIIFSNTSINNVKTMNHFLMEFQNMSGLEINKNKSNFLISKDVSQDKINYIKRICGFSFLSLPIKYLGTPIFKGRKRNHIFEEIISVFQKKIYNWHSKFLSFGGRLVLIKSVLNSIPIYIFHTLNPTASICLRMERLINKFFWGAKMNSSCICWSSSKKVCGTLNEGALDCKSFLDMVKAFSYKLWFSFRANDSLWSKFMHAKYCKDRSEICCTYKTSDSPV